MSEEEILEIGDPIYARVCRRIRADIIAGTLRPGQRLKISDLKARYRVSQMPIREALQQLQGEWLVTISPNRGACVRAVDDQFIRNMYEIRAVIEGQLARRCAELASAADLERVAELMAAFADAVHRNDLAATMDINRRLHEVIFDLGSNAVASDLLKRHFGIIAALRKKYGLQPERLGQMITEHQSLLEALRGRDLDRAEREARQHSYHACEDLLASVRLELSAQASEDREQVAANLL
jgi:DNA-binding GntR family transcriptional regulator